jgi:outer membrane receptor for ferrienterochelin and colicin
MAGFDRRRASSNGTFITREEIEHRNPQRLSQMFYSVPGVRVGGSAMGDTHTDLYSSRSRYSCPMLYYLDGIRQPPTSGFGIDILPPQDIEGIEVYLGPSGTPAVFRYRGGHCGVVAIWTRDPTRR